jgi:hypothetical protein
MQNSELPTPAQPVEDAVSPNNNVKLRDFDDFDSLRTDIFTGVKNAMSKAFPAEYGNVRVELHDVDYDDTEPVSLSQQKKMLLENKYLTKKLRGTVKLFDKTTNEPLEEKRLSLMRVPYLTGRGTFIHGGNEYASIMQSRLLPGVYTRRQANGELETQFNVKPGTGAGFRIGFEPDTAQYRIKISQANLHMYSLFRDLGIPDAEMEGSWGKEIFKANQAKYDARVLDKAYDRLVPARQKKLDKTKEDKIKAIKAAFEAAQIHARVAKKNLPNMFDPKVAAAWNAQWMGIKAASANVDAMEFNPDLTPDEVYENYFNAEEGIKSAADMRALNQARQLSRQAKEAYKQKTAIMVAALAKYPNEFIVDENGPMAGVTHLPSGFRIHVPHKVVPIHIRRVFAEAEEPDSTEAELHTIPAYAKAAMEVPATPDAYIIKGNPEVMGEDKPKYDAFYNSVADVLKAKGLSVGFDDGLAHTLPPGGKYWVGHSRGIGRLRFAPEGVKTLRLDDFEPEETRRANEESAAKVMKELGVSSFADVPVAKRRAPGPEHYTLNEAAIKALQAMVESDKAAATQTPTTPAPTAPSVSPQPSAKRKWTSPKMPEGGLTWKHIKNRNIPGQEIPTAHPAPYVEPQLPDPRLGMGNQPAFETQARGMFENEFLDKDKAMEQARPKSLGIEPQPVLLAKRGSEFSPDLSPDELQEAYNNLYGKVGPRLAGSKQWPKEWIPQSSGLGWLDWYTQYKNGKQSEDDEEQIKRWKSFKARNTPVFIKKPTPRMAFSLRNWAIDPMKLIKDEKVRSQLKKDMEEYKRTAWEEHEASKT